MSKGALNRLRTEGVIPGIVYGGAKDMNLPVQITERDLNVVLAKASESAFFTLQLDDGSTHLVLPREIQYGKIKRDLRHIDLLVVEADAEVRTTIPVHIVGTNEAPLQYGLLEIEVRAKPADIPAAFEVDVSKLQMGHTVFVSDLDIPAAVELFSPLEETVVSVVASSQQLEEEEPTDEVAEAEHDTADEPKAE
jgi:large subunit ribosomal protein L25